MIYLFIDTSSSDLSIALIKDNKVLSSVSEVLPNLHSVYATKYLSDVIVEAGISTWDIDKIFVVNGPGSFTGIRIGVTIAKTYAYLLGIDVCLVSSLRMRSISFDHSFSMVLMNARHDNYYCGLYDVNNNDVVLEAFRNKDEVIDLINKYNPTVVSDSIIDSNGIKAVRQEVDFVRVVNYYKNNKVDNVHMVVPNYLKLPQVLEER